MKGSGHTNGLLHRELPKPSKELVGVKTHDELLRLLLVRRQKLFHKILYVLLLCVFVYDLQRVLVILYCTYATIFGVSWQAHIHLLVQYQQNMWIELIKSWAVESLVCLYSTRLTDSSIRRVRHRYPCGWIQSPFTVVCGLKAEPNPSQLHTCCTRSIRTLLLLGCASARILLGATLSFERIIVRSAAVGR